MAVRVLWLSFKSDYIVDRRTPYPFALKIATGKISAITGDSWHHGLTRNPQDYLVVPEQPWLDGYCVEKGIIRQFVAMPLGQGYSVEEQITGEAEYGGMQIEIFPMRADVFHKRFPIIARHDESLDVFEQRTTCSSESSGMGLAPGGRMRQEIFADPFSIHDWDTAHTSRCFIHLVNSSTWHAITNQRPPSRPPTARDYTKAGYPWFDYYDAELKALDGSLSLAAVKSVKKIAQEKHAAALADNETLSIPNIVNLRAGLKKNQVREFDFS